MDMMHKSICERKAQNVLGAIRIHLSFFKYKTQGSKAAKNVSAKHEASGSEATKNEIVECIWAIYVPTE